MKTQRLVMAAAFAVALAGKGGAEQSAPPPPAREVKHEHGDKKSDFSGVVSFDVVGEPEQLHVLELLTTGTDKFELWYRASAHVGGTWNFASRIDVGAEPPFGLHRGNDVQLAVAGNQRLAVWQIKGTGYGGRGPMRLALSDDQGRTWHRIPGPDGDRIGDSQAFVDAVADSEGRFHVVWLDDSNRVKGIRRAVFDGKTRKWSAIQTIDGDCCQCCWNVVAARGTDLFVLYRDASPRDLTLAALPADGPVQSTPVGNFAWNFQGCPHVGGALAVTKAGEHCLVWSGAPDKTGLFYFLRRDGKWIQELPLGQNARHGDLAAAPNGDLLLVYDASDPDGSGIFFRRSTDAGATWTPPKQVARGSTLDHPRAVATEDGFQIFWSHTAGNDVLRESMDLP